MNDTVNDCYSGDGFSGNNGFGGTKPPDDEILFTISGFTVLVELFYYHYPTRCKVLNHPLTELQTINEVTTNNRFSGNDRFSGTKPLTVFSTVTVLDCNPMQCNVILRAWFVRHRHYLEQTKTFALVFVLAHEH